MRKKSPETRKSFDDHNNNNNNNNEEVDRERVEEFQLRQRTGTENRETREEEDGVFIRNARVAEKGEERKKDDGKEEAKGKGQDETVRTKITTTEDNFNFKLTSFSLDKVKRDDDILVLLHRLLYKTPGKEQSRKRDVLDFSGFVYEDETKDREKKVVAWRKSLPKPRFQIMDMFDLPRGSGAEGSKERRKSNGF